MSSNDTARAGARGVALKRRVARTRVRRSHPLKGLAGAMDESKLKRVEAIVLSMTPKERSRPEILNGKRRLRLAKGSGSSFQKALKPPSANSARCFNPNTAAVTSGAAWLKVAGKLRAGV